jgi:thiosulfate/3-mercaptopyruvate sulfurtransferase
VYKAGTGKFAMYADLVTATELKLLVAADRCRVVDCRFDLFDAQKGYRDYLAGHIPGAVHADMDKDLAGEITRHSGRHPLPGAEDFIATLRGWGIHNDTLVVGYDYGNGALAARLWWMLRFWLGHENAAVLQGGLAAWQSAGGSLESAEPAYPAGSFAASADDSPIVTSDEIARAIEAGRDINLVDVRDPTRFRGESEPIDTTAGHIPGARNLPLGVSLDADGNWRQPAELAQIWRDFQAGGPQEPPVAMCGSGVTACHLVLSAILAGLEAPRLYVGSWSEWIRDPERPIVVEK